MNGKCFFLFYICCFMLFCLESMPRISKAKKKFAAVVYGNKIKCVEIIFISAVAILMEKVCDYFIEAFPYKLKEASNTCNTHQWKLQYNDVPFFSLKIKLLFKCDVFLSSPNKLKIKTSLLWYCTHLKPLTMKGFTF